ncbi:hypothetical protein Fmac_020066 [Flemingia macrophylla]|uniref:Uncharacterized protein n=1 Tax=Flemingia macrophylla TaxID=520843 RepID=A0ABD1M9P0_9FABA
MEHQGSPRTIKLNIIYSKPDVSHFIDLWFTPNMMNISSGRLYRNRSSTVGPAPLQPIPAPDRSGTSASGNAPGEPTSAKSVTLTTTDAPGSQPSTTPMKPPALATPPRLRRRCA